MSVECETAPGGAAQACSAGRDVSWGLGVALIVFGVVALGVRVVPQASWLTMWPVFIIAAGFVQMIVPSRYEGWTARRFADGVGTVLFGVAFLGCTTGYVSWSMWLTLLSLWPLLLVVAGLQVLASATRQSWLSAAATLLVWGALLLSAAGSWTGSQSFPALSAQAIHAVAESPGTFAAAVADGIVDTVVGQPAPAAE